MKRSKRERKFVNSMRSMAEVPWPARRFKYPPTFGNRRTRSAISARIRRRYEKQLNQLVGMAREADEAQRHLERAMQQRSQRELAAQKRSLFKRATRRIFSRRKV